MTGVDSCEAGKLLIALGLNQKPCAINGFHLRAKANSPSVLLFSRDHAAHATRGSSASPGRLEIRCTCACITVCPAAMPALTPMLNATTSGDVSLILARP